MRRPATTLLVLLPLLLALLYAGGYALLAPRPTLSDVVPKAAVLTARFRGVEGLDRHWPFDRPEGLRISEALARQRNVPGLPGVDRSGPIHVVILPRQTLTDSDLLILPLSDASALRDRFEGRDVPEGDARGLERHAQHLEVRGGFAALAWDREIVRHLGEGGLTCEDRGEDLALAIHMEGLAAYALLDAARPPWKKIIEALGGEPAKVVARVDETTGRRMLDFPAGRVPVVARGWRTARLWAWGARGEQKAAVEVELEPADKRLAELLASTADGQAPAPGPVPTDALAWLEVYGPKGRSVLARALHLCGTKGVEGLFDDATRAAEGATLRAFALANAEEGHAWTVVLTSSDGTLPSLKPLLPDLPPPGAALDLEAGAAPLTLSDTGWDGLAPAGKVVRASLPGGAGDALLVGVDAASHAARRAAPRETRTPGEAPLPPTWRLLARFGLAGQRVHAVLGPLLSEGGLLSVLTGGALEGDLLTDGRVLRLRLRPAAP